MATEDHISQLASQATIQSTSAQRIEALPHVIPDTEEKMQHTSFSDMYEIQQRIDMGTFGMVHKAVRKSDGKEFAVKKIEKLSLTGKDYARMAQEIQILNEISKESEHAHADILLDAKGIFGWHDDTKKIVHMVFELCPGGSLADEIQVSNGAGLGEERSARVIIDIARGLNALHELSIVHRNLCAENILLTADRRVKIGNFYWAHYLHGVPPEEITMHTRFCGSLEYVAPEMLSEEEYGFKVDFWSAGVLLYYMLCGRLPFAFNCEEVKVSDVLTSIKQCNYPKELLDNVCPEAKDCVTRLICTDVTERLGGEDLLAHPWIVEFLARA